MNSRRLLLAGILAQMLVLNTYADIRLPSPVAAQEDKEERDIKKIKKQMRQQNQKPTGPQTVVRRRGGRKITMTITPKKTFSTMTYEELKEAKDRHKKNKSTETALKYLDRLIKLCDNPHEIGELMLEFSDLLFDDGKYDKAGTIYNEFTHLYPGNEKTEYALYRAIVCTSKKISSSDRDQTKTEETIALADKFLARPDAFTTYKKEVEEIKHECCKTLIESELNICAFYVKQEKFKAASNRLHHVREKWLPRLPEIEDELLDVEINLGAKYPAFLNLESGETVLHVEKKEVAQNKTDFSKKF